MKPATTLKELLKPPFYDHCGCGEVYCGVNEADYGASRLVQSWMGFFQYFENGEQLQDEFKEFVVQALNEKWVCDFGEPLRWITRYTGDVEYLKCPKCNWDDLDTNSETIHNYCPCCGQRLLPPEEAQEK